MNLETFYIIGATLVIASAMLSVSLFVYILLRRHRAHIRWFLWMMAAVLAWQLAAVMYFISPTPAVAGFWISKVKFLCVAALPVTLLTMTLHYTGHLRWLRPRYLVLLFLIPSVTQILSFTNSPFFITDRVFHRHGPYLIEISQRLHPWFWVHTFYSYSLCAISVLLLIRFAVRSRYPYRVQAAIMIGSALLAFLVNALTVFNVITPEPPEFTALIFGALTFIWAWALSRYNLMDIMPVARDTVVESMADAVIVLDVQNRIVDMNPAAQAMTVSGASCMIGKPVREMWPAQQLLIDRYEGVKEAQAEIVLDQEPVQRVFDLNISTFYQRNHEKAGRLVVLRDITERKNIENRLKDMNEELENQLAENQILQEALKQQAIRDPLTGVFNRGYFEEMLQKSRARLQRTGERFGLVMIDIDKFKSINDTYGHSAGDKLLKSLSTLLTVDTRQEDSVCRYGGDEFIIILPGIDRHVATIRAEGWRAKFETGQCNVGGKTITATLSMGVAVSSEAAYSPDEMVNIIDKALYQSKLAGRNRVTVHDG